MAGCRSASGGRGFFLAVAASLACSSAAAVVAPNAGMHSAFLVPRQSPIRRAAVRLAEVLVGPEQEMITITPGAMAQLVALKESQGGEVVLRMGVRSGGCSGMSYVMDMIAADAIGEQDLVIEYPEQGLRCVIDPKSSMFLYGLQLDYSNQLIGGGFGFKARVRRAPFLRVRRLLRAPAHLPALPGVRSPPSADAESKRRVHVRLRLVLQRLSTSHCCLHSARSAARPRTPCRCAH